MRFPVFIVVTFCLVGVMSLSLSSSDQLTGPVFMWSGSPYFHHRSSEVLDHVTGQDVLGALEALTRTEPISSNALLKHVSVPKDAPEVVVVFLQPKLSASQFSQQSRSYDPDSDGGDHANLRSAIRSAASALILPYATAPEHSFSAALAADLELPGTAVLASNDADADVPLKRLIAHLSRADYYDNGATDLVVVSIDDASPDSDALVKQVNALLVNKMPNGNWLCLYAGDEVAHDVHQSSYTAPEARIGLNLATAVRRQSSNSSDIAGTYFPKQVWEGLVVSIVVVFGVLVGTICTCYLQVPPKLLDVEEMRRRKRA